MVGLIYTGDYVTDAIEIALIGVLGTAVSSGVSIVVLVLLKRLEVKVDGRLTDLIEANRRADTAKGRQDERDSHKTRTGHERTDKR